MKIAIAVLLTLLAILLALAWLLNVEMATSRQLRGQLADKTARENLELQEKCATQADKVFRQFGYSLSTDTAAIQSHFNVKLNKCFMSFVVTIFKAGYSQESYLLDAYEQRPYAELNVRGGGSSLSRLVASCRLMPLGGKESDCKSEEEYKTFVAIYME